MALSWILLWYMSCLQDSSCVFVLEVTGFWDMVLCQWLIGFPQLELKMCLQNTRTLIPNNTDPNPDTLLFYSWFFEIYDNSITYFMEHSPSWEANQLAASQEIPLLLWNLKVHYCSYRCPTPVPILSQLNAVQTPHPTFSRFILILSYPLC
jgi:hypothetical protein